MILKRSVTHRGQPPVQCNVISPRPVAALLAACATWGLLLAPEEDAAGLVEAGYKPLALQVVDRRSAVHTCVPLRAHAPVPAEIREHHDRQEAEDGLQHHLRSLRGGDGRRGHAALSPG